MTVHTVKQAEIASTSEEQHIVSADIGKILKQFMSIS